VTMAKVHVARHAHVGSAEFKSRCLEFVDRVRTTRTEIVVTRHGQPVAKLVPVQVARPMSFVGSMAGSVQRFSEPFDAVPGAWGQDSPADEP
jgi:prevent-host-death family protein